VSARKPAIIGGLIMLLGAALLVFFLVHDPGAKFGTLRLHYETAETSEAQAEGLSGRDSLAANAGMLFIYPEPSNHCFWMKDMKFPLDIIWLNENKRVVTIEEDVKPETYPKSFCPDLPAMYVIEVNAGTVNKAGVHKGDQLQF